MNYMLPHRGHSFASMTAVVLLLSVIGAVAYARAGRPDSDQALHAAAVQQPPGASAGTRPAPPAGPPANAKFGPHKQANLPPLPFTGYPPPRPPAVVAAAYRFAAEHPEVLAYVPCYCGCERSGHRGNDDCFVTSRAANGDVVSWEPHGMT